MIPLPASVTTLAFGFGPIGWPELLILGFLGLLIFGKRLPAMGKGLGQFFVEFKRGLKGTPEAEADVTDAPRIERQPAAGAAASSPTKRAAV